MAAPSKKAFEVFVSKVPWTVATKEIKEYFGQFGQIRRLTLPFDKERGFHKGICWIGFTSEQSLNNILQTEPHVLDGARLQVQQHRIFAGQRSNEGHTTEDD